MYIFPLQALVIIINRGTIIAILNLHRFLMVGDRGEKDADQLHVYAAGLVTAAQK
jgi:hypothetical protein